MKKRIILVVDDATMILSLLEDHLKSDTIDVIKAKNYHEAQKAINELQDEISVAILDFHLPDAPYVK